MRFPKTILTDYLLPSPASKLLKALPLPNPPQELLPNTPVPRGFEFLYFTPPNPEPTLGSDGYDDYQAPKGYSRRVWAGGSLSYIPGNPLLFGHLLSCIEDVVKVRNLKNSAMVNIERNFFNEDDISVKETRTLVYTNTKFDPRSARIYAGELFKEYDESRDFCMSRTTLFRYSALTYNAHKIHYDLEWARREGYPDVVVHGPLTVTMMMSMFQGPMSLFEYRNRFPLFAGERAKMRRKGGLVWVENGDGVVCVEGKARGYE